MLSTKRVFPRCTRKIRRINVVLFPNQSANSGSLPLSLQEISFESFYIKDEADGFLNLKEPLREVGHFYDIVFPFCTHVVGDRMPLIARRRRIRSQPQKMAL